MDNCNLFIFLQFLFLLVPLLLAFSAQDNQVYIVYLGEHHGDKTHQEIEENHHSFLFSVKETEEDAKSSLIYSYKRSINGFAAFLTQREASEISKREEVVSVFQSHPRKYALHTTRSWEFSGLPEATNSSKDKNSLLYKSGYGKGVIVGMLDTGIWPESESFNDEGMDDVPQQWNGTCQTGEAFNTSQCNKKIIGARYYLKGYEAHLGPLNKSFDVKSPRDMNGHGTHTASTAAGRAVKNTFTLGSFAAGIASGGAPLAHLAIYKNGIVIGCLHAVRNNIVVACSAGNGGPLSGTVEDVAPWTITVGASSIDRVFPAVVVLGSGFQLQGQTVTSYQMRNKLHPLVFAGDVTKPDVPKNESGQCLPDSLSPEKVKGNIVLCWRGEGLRIRKGMEVKRAGGIGFILGNNEAYANDLTVDAHVLPATHVTYEDALRILEYINTTKQPNARITPAQTVVGNIRAPFIPSFSSRGPNLFSPQILKPDIAAPGLNILAAWSKASGPSMVREDKRVVKYNIISGTSMSCPHVGGVLALLKAVHPDWSSAALRSALMTSARVVDNEGKPIMDATDSQAVPFHFRSAVFDPNKAADPGLVYDATYKDYLLFLCSMKFNKLVHPFKCPKRLPCPFNLNYPSVAIPQRKSSVTITRTVTNVGPAQSVYSSSIETPPGTHVNIWPSKLHFNHTGQKKCFTITIKMGGNFTSGVRMHNYSFGCLRPFPKWRSTKLLSARTGSVGLGRRGKRIVVVGAVTVVVGSVTRDWAPLRSVAYLVLRGGVSGLLAVGSECRDGSILESGYRIKLVSGVDQSLMLGLVGYTGSDILGFGWEGLWFWGVCGWDLLRTIRVFWWRFPVEGYVGFPVGSG
ncbi:subtilase family protein [Striga hermonthica]|uniref:Subtilase family protein n=1 Tax=Striga hermonthica TaxID=68872 RepID=A0A9N7NS36_STRHE|nr:subtilase family protein [Striga hermonthica]